MMTPEYGHHWEEEQGRMALTYVVGDIHGSLHKLKSLIAACQKDASGEPMTLVLLGDYIDRGEDSAGVLRFIMSLEQEMSERLVALKGNHEAWALGVAAGTMKLSTWLANGGDATLESYGASEVGELPAAHLKWMSGLRSSFDDGRRFFVHGGVNPERPLDAQDEMDLLWIREPFLSDGRDYGRLIVHGHTPLAAARPELRPNRLNLDTGAVFGGALTAAVFNAEQTKPLKYLQAK
jgi:serine/threonine protein phosphatase 1